MRYRKAIDSRAAGRNFPALGCLPALAITVASLAFANVGCAMPSATELDDLAQARARLDPDKLLADFPGGARWLDAHTVTFTLTTGGVSVTKTIDGRTGASIEQMRRGRPRRSCSSIAASTCDADAPTNRTDAIMSPDHHWAVFTRAHNIWLRDLLESKETQLTFDGIPDYAYGELPDAVGTPLKDLVHGNTQLPRIMWSPDSRKFLTYRADQRLVEAAAVIRYITPGHDASRPEVLSPRRHFPGDLNVTTAQLIVFGVDNGTRVDLHIPPLTMAYEPLSVDANDDAGWRLHTGLVRWNTRSNKIYVVDEARGFGEYTYYAVDAVSGAAHAIFTEAKGTARYVQPSIYRYPPEIYSIDRDRAIIMVSQRDGWAHLYKYDAEGTNDLVGRLTRGDWNVGKVLRIDEPRGWIYFSAVGKEAGDPYLRQIYRVRLDGGEPQRLSPENADHDATFSPDGSYFLDTFSTVSTPPKLILRRADGAFIKLLATANLDLLMASGMILPERFHVKARDGATDIYGVLYRPRNFDPTKIYPIIDFDYGSQNTIHASRTFEVIPEQSFNELGYLGVTIDGMGTPMRSVQFRDMEDYRGAAGLADHPGAIQQLARRYAFVDKDRVGIYGCSGGGYGAALGILKYPDFYKVAVSAYGNNDQRLYSLQVGERYLGMPYQVPEVYADQATKNLAGNLRGHLLVIQGLMDDLVNPAITFQFAQALIDADKDFDMMILPNASHCDDSPYYWRLVWRYFQMHLTPNSKLLTH